jgi:hypothetical protein
VCVCGGQCRKHAAMPLTALGCLWRHAPAPLLHRRC